MGRYLQVPQWLSLISPAGWLLQHLEWLGSISTLSSPWWALLWAGLHSSGPPSFYFGEVVGPHLAPPLASLLQIFFEFSFYGKQDTPNLSRRKRDGQSVQGGDCCPKTWPAGLFSRAAATATVCHRTHLLDSRLRIEKIKMEEPQMCSLWTTALSSPTS